MKNWKADPIIDINFGDYNGDGNMDLALLIGGRDYKGNVIEIVQLKGRKVLDMMTSFNQSYSSTFGRFTALGEIITCDNVVFPFINSSQSKNSFFEIGH